MQKRNQKENTNKTSTHYPIRINRYLYLKNYCSRRQADRYITEGLVFINGRKAVLGDQVKESDEVKVDAKVEKAKEEYSYLAYFKPKGIVSHNPQKNETSIESVLLLPSNFKNKKFAPLGRLDKDSEGLMILSDDGRIVNRLLSPETEHEKEYIVTVDKNIPGTHLRKMELGVNIEGYRTKPAKTKIVTSKTFKLILVEGKKHQIRRMCASLGYQVRNLKRVRIKNIKIEKLSENQYREIEGHELETFLKGLLSK